MRNDPFKKPYFCINQLCGISAAGLANAFLTACNQRGQGVRRLGISGLLMPGRITLMTTLCTACGSALRVSLPSCAPQQGTDAFRQFQSPFTRKTLILTGEGGGGGEKCWSTAGVLSSMDPTPDWLPWELWICHHVLLTLCRWSVFGHAARYAAVSEWRIGLVPACRSARSRWCTRWRKRHECMVMHAAPPSVTPSFRVSYYVRCQKFSIRGRRTL